MTLHSDCFTWVSILSFHFKGFETKNWNIKAVSTRRLCICLVVQFYPTLCESMGCSPQVSSVHGTFSGKNTRVGCHFPLQGIFLTQGSNLHLLWPLHCRWILSPLSHWGSHKKIVVVLLFSRQVMSYSSRPHLLQHARLPVPHHLLEFVQVHVNWIGDAIQTSHPLSPPSPSTFNLSQHQGLSQWRRLGVSNLQDDVEKRYGPSGKRQTHVHEYVLGGNKIFKMCIFQRFIFLNHLFN